jgi:hypothetical protein
MAFRAWELRARELRVWELRVWERSVWEVRTETRLTVNFPGAIGIWGNARADRSIC